MRDDFLCIRALTPADAPVWALLTRQPSDTAVVRELLADPAIFYAGFDLYMDAKIRQGEAFMVMDANSGAYLGIVAFSRTHNRITFLGVFDQYSLIQVGSALLTYAVNQLNPLLPIRSTVLRSSHEKVAAERHLYEAHGFVPCGDTIEAGAPATIMERPANS